MNFLNQILIPFLSATLGATSIAVLNYIFNLKQKRYELREKFKREAYRDFLNKAGAFLNDPNLSAKEIIEQQHEFIGRYYSDIMVSAPEEVIKSIEDFFGTVSITHTNPDDKTRALDKVLREIRKDLGLGEAKELERLFKGYTPHTGQILKEKGGMSPE